MGEFAQEAARIAERAGSMRRDIIELAFRAGANGAHLGPGLSIVEITATLFCGTMRIRPGDPKWEDRDRFILSKGHGSLGYYTAMAEAGVISREDLFTFEANGGAFPGQPSKNEEKGIEFSSGSLGLGLSLGIGVALSARRKGKDFKTYVLMGDGECNEGTVWEAAMAASHFKLSNLVAIVDRNGIQSDGLSKSILDMDDFAAKWRSFGWVVAEVDGHDVEALLEAFLGTNRPTDRPFAVIARTVKGKGVSFMEGNNEWHHNRLTAEQLEAALKELGA